VRAAVRVCVPGYGHWWLWVATYDTRRQLIEAAANYQGIPVSQVDMSEKEEDGILGCFSDNKLKTNYLGIMRLWDLGIETIMHESIHAAVSMAGKVHGFKHLSTVKEEAIAYSATAITMAVHEALFGENDEGDAAGLHQGTGPFSEPCNWRNRGSHAVAQVEPLPHSGVAAG
jgi:hypothetical protein